jgi:tRNA (guanine37-N1)-methyltransferase
MDVESGMAGMMQTLEIKNTIYQVERKMSHFVPPLVKAVANSRILDKSLFRRVIRIPVIRVDASEVAGLRTGLLKDVVLVVPRLKTIIPDQHDPSKRLILLDESKLDKSSALSEHLLQHELVLDYDFWSAEELLRCILPEDICIPSSYEMVGHLLHLNLLPQHTPYKHLIGHILLSKHHPHIRTIVNKTGNIETKFRFFEMEVLAGEEDTMVSVNEEGCRFTFDYSRVYWNSKLQQEHKRVVGLMNRDSVVVDVFAGVGPFAIPAAKHKRCKVLANDLNPESFKYLNENVKLNKVDARVHAFNLDGREFLRKVFKDASTIDHVIMNLPASAHEFLDVFNDIDSKGAMIHCYVFVRAGSADAVTLIKQVLHKDIHPSLIHHVRNVAPNKDMYCVSFKLLDSTTPPIPSIRDDAARPEKRTRIDDE